MNSCGKNVKMFIHSYHFKDVHCYHFYGNNVRMFIFMELKSYVFSQGIAKEENNQYTETTKELYDCLEGETDDIMNQIESLMKVVIVFSIY